MRNGVLAITKARGSIDWKCRPHLEGIRVQASMKKKGQSTDGQPFALFVANKQTSGKKKNQQQIAYIITLPRQATTCR